MVIIPVQDSSFVYFTQTTTLDGVDYFLEFRYNAREQVFYLQLSLTDGTVVIQGLKLVCNFPLLRLFTDPNVPPGELMCSSSGTDDSPPGLGDLDAGGRVTLVYYTQGEIQAVGLDPWRNPNG